MNTKETMQRVNYSKFTTGNYYPGASFIKRSVWHLVNYILLDSFIPGSSWRAFLLRLFGAKIGFRPVIKPKVRVKYPWFLEAGKNLWIGESVWIDNLGRLEIGDNVCISQGALILSGNHNYKKESFDLMVQKIVLEDGVWIGAKSVVTGGVVCGTHSILAVSSVASKNLEPYKIYRGNPAIAVGERNIS